METVGMYLERKLTNEVASIKMSRSSLLSLHKERSDAIGGLGLEVMKQYAGIPIIEKPEGAIQFFDANGKELFL